MGNIHVKLFLFRPVVLELSFKEKVYTQWVYDGQRPITIAHIEPLAQVS